ncbi:hypothetical protein [Kitasatospora sp. NPDC059327]|uniref:hypothetical protein n=1 Tax=Kitasatospora sp. NPDC059327 TaxID=3346803 RepID=UPI0036BF30A7
MVDPLARAGDEALVLAQVGPAGLVPDVLRGHVGAGAVGGQYLGRLRERRGRIGRVGLLEEAGQPAARRVRGAEEVAAVLAPPVVIGRCGRPGWGGPWCGGRRGGRCGFAGLGLGAVGFAAQEREQYRAGRPVRAFGTGFGHWGRAHTRVRSSPSAGWSAAGGAAPVMPGS